MNSNRVGRKRFNTVLFVSCLVGAAIGWIAAELLYGTVMENTPTVLRVGVYFALLITFVVLAAFLSELVVCRVKSAWMGKEIGVAAGFTALAIVAFFAMGVLFQFLYSLGYKRADLTSVNDYLIAVDNSGSTTTSDPDNQRFTGVEALVDNLDPTNGFTVEVFDDKIVGKLDYALADDQGQAALKQFNVQMAQADMGGTDVQLVLDDLINGYQSSAGRSAAVILLSDGESYLDYDYLLNLYNSKNIPIYCVAFSNMSFDGRRTMTKLAEGSNGYYCEIDDLQNLTGTVQRMIELTSQRNLLERRRGTDVRKILPMLLRLLFLTIFGIMVEVFLALILDYRDLITSSLLIHLPFSVFAAVIMEFIFRFIPLPSIMRLLMCLSMSVVIAMYMHYTYNLTGSGSDDSADTPVSLKRRESGTADDLRKKKRNPSDGKSLV